MTRSDATMALRALLVAAALLALTLFAAANFVLVDVRLPGGDVRLRLAWVAVVPSLCGFAVGMAHARLSRRHRAVVSARRGTRNNHLEPDDRRLGIEEPPGHGSQQTRPRRPRRRP